MIESEAKTKWCPFAQIDGMNRYPTGEPATRCVGSDCMMWRATDNVYLPEPQTTSVIKESVPAGYCGLAGKDG